MAYITPEQALNRFLPKRRAGQAAPSQQVIKFDGTVGEKNLLYVITNETSGTSYLSPADDTLNPILMEWEAQENTVEIPESMQGWLECYEAEIEWWQKEGYKIASTSKSRRAASVSNSQEPTARTDTTEYIIEDVPKYAQNAPYYNKLNFGDDYITYKGKSHWPCTGCSATSSAQVLVYWGKKGYYIGCNAITPYARTDTDSSVGYRVNNKYEVNVNLPAISRFDFSNILNRYYEEDAQGHNTISSSAAQRNAIADFMLYVVTALKSCPTYSLTQKKYTGGVGCRPNHKVEGLWKKFYMDCTAYALFNYTYYTKVSSWETIVYGGTDTNGKQVMSIYDEIKNGYPVIISGNKSGFGGHAFVCHGYKNEWETVNGVDTLVTKLYIDWGADSYEKMWCVASALDFEVGGSGFVDFRSVIYAHPRYSKDNVTPQQLISLINNDSKLSIYEKDIDHSGKQALADVEALVQWLVCDMDRIPEHKKTLKLASVISINKSCREIISKLNKLGYK